MKINRGPGCLNSRRSSSKRSKELNSFREELEASDLRLDKGLMVLLLGDNMALTHDRATMFMEVMDRETLVEDQ